MQNDKEMIVEGYAIVFNQPTVLWEYKGEKIYEVIDSKALNGCDLSDVCFRYNHSDQVFMVAATRNNTLKLTIDDYGLKIRAKLVNTTVGKDLYQMIRTRLLNKMSFAFVVGEEEYDRETKTRIIKKIKKVIEVSAVDFPAYPQTSLYCEGDELESLKAEIRRKVNGLTVNSDELEIEKLKIKIKVMGYE